MAGILGLAPAQAALSQTNYTDIGLYLHASSISGEARLGPVTVDVDESFSGILNQLDLGFMGYIEHKRHNWIFLADLFYVKLSDDNSKVFNPLVSINVESEIKQLIAQGFVGYRLHENNEGHSSFSLDLLAGLRYNDVEMTLGAQAYIFNTALGGNRSRTEQWLDGVGALRAQFGFGSGWTLTGWADVGKGSDSNSYQLAGILRFSFANDVKLFAGYKHYHYKYDAQDSITRNLYLDLDYSGPLLGLSYRFG